MIEELKPCPFCGGKAEFEQFANPKNFYCVRCHECKCGTDGFDLNRTDNTAEENKAINAAVWNRRVTSKVKLENAQLRAVISGNDPDFFKRKCRVCGCDWNHACNDRDYWAEEDLCSSCAENLKGRRT